MDVLVWAIGSGLLGGIGFLLGRFVWPATSSIDPATFTAAQNESLSRAEECRHLRARAEELSQQCTATLEEAKTSREDVARFTERVTLLTQQHAEQVVLLQKIEAEKHAAHDDAKRAGEELAKLAERERALTEKIQSQAVQLQEMQQQLTTEFENIANRILKANVHELSETSHNKLSEILQPFRDRMVEFQQKVETTYDAERREVLSLKEHIKVMVETTHAIGTQADDLAKALRGNSQLLGRWGELTLERILEAAGLQEGREFITQGRGLKLKSDEGISQRPDVIIRLPECRTMIIDSKVPLASYERLINTADESELVEVKRQFVSDVKSHIDGLASKRYQENSSLRAHDCVLMFVPIEGALAAALTCEPELFTYAWDRHVVLVGPPTLLMTLRTVAHIWRYQQQGENAQEIARLAGELLDKITNSIDDLNAVAQKIESAAEAHRDAMKRLFQGRGNAISIGERIKGMGVKAKPIPNIIIDGIPLVEHSTGDEDLQQNAPAGIESDTAAASKLFDG